MNAALSVRVAGNQASGNVMIALHGGPGQSHHYMLDLERLAGREFAVVTYDQRGVGGSTTPPADPAYYDLTDYVEDLEAVRRAVGASRFSTQGGSSSSTSSTITRLPARAMAAAAAWDPVTMLGHTGRTISCLSHRSF